MAYSRTWWQGYDVSERKSKGKEQNNRKVGEKWEKHKNLVLFILFEKGTLLVMIAPPKTSLE